MTNTKSVAVRFLYCVAWVLVSNIVNGGELITHTINSERLAGNLVGETTEQRIFVQVPDGYEGSQADYPVIYWFPGARQTQTAGISTKLLDAEFESGRSVPAIIVFMPGKTSFGPTAYLSSDAFGDWEGFVTSEVIPFVDATYRTQATPDKRGIMGFSLGGFTAFTLPSLAPNTFGAMGGNDPSSSLIASLVRDLEEIPEDVVFDDELTLEEFLDEFFGAFPDSIEGFQDVSVLASIYGQIATRLSPNPDAPLLGDIPFDRQGEWIPETRAEWREFDLLDPASVELHKDALQDLATMTVLLPDAKKGVTSVWNREMIRVLRAAGIPAQGIDVVGDHNDSQHDRFTTLLSNVTFALNGENRTILVGEDYGQDFDETLGVDDSSSVLLPPGWSVTDGFAHVFRDRTNTPLAGGNVEAIGVGPFILNARGDQEADRALAIYLPEDSDNATIQFLADVSEVEATAFQLKFDVEAWETNGEVPILEAGEALFHVTIEFDSGSGFEQFADLGDVGFSNLSSSGDPSVSTQVSFDSGLLTAPISEASAVRLRWTADISEGARNWLLGLDNAELTFLLLGDFNGDNTIDVSDIDVLSAAVRANDAAAEFDLNGDGAVDDLDRDHWIHELAGSTFGDANLDATVDFSDFLLLSASFGLAGGWGSGDFDGDGEVEFRDFLLLSSNFGVSQNIASVPEPSSMPAVLACLLAIAAARRRTRKF